MESVTDYISPNSCRSLPGLFLKRVAESTHETAYQHYNKQISAWEKISWQQTKKYVMRYRSALQAESLQAGDRVALMLPNSLDWVAFEQASLSLGLLVVPLYSNDRPDNIAYILNETDAKIFLCPGLSYWQQLLTVLDETKNLQRIITVDNCKIRLEEPRLICLTDWLPEHSDDQTDYEPLVSETATIVYTSGTTGPPKGVMLSHSNILENSFAGLQCIDIFASDNFLSFLPLSHMLERTAGYYMPMMAGATVTFARSIPYLAEDLLSINPTILVSVPRIFERIYAGVMSKLESRPPVMQKLFHKAVETGWKSFLYKQGRGPWSPSLLLSSFFDTIVAKKVREKLGGQLRIIIAGGAALSTDIAKFFIGLGLPIYQGYGLTETSPVISVNQVSDNRPEGVGLPLPGVEVKVSNQGELLVRGHCVMQGYWKNVNATTEAIDKDGWLHTGDKAILQDGHVKITGRIKEIIVLSSGEKISPVDLEMAISLDPLFENNIVIGEGRPYLTLLCVLNQPVWEEIAERLSVPIQADSLNQPKVRKAILARVEQLLSSFPGFIFIKDIGISLSPWTVENGLLTPTMKMKRKVIESHMSDDISRMYGP